MLAVQNFAAAEYAFSDFFFAWVIALISASSSPSQLASARFTIVSNPDGFLKMFSKLMERSRPEEFANSRARRFGSGAESLQAFCEGYAVSQE